MQIKALLNGRICTEEHETKCLENYEEIARDWACANCKGWLKEVHPWVAHLFSVYSLQQAGYPFDKNDLSMEEWMALGVINQEVKALEAGAQQEEDNGD